MTNFEKIEIPIRWVLMADTIIQLNEVVSAQDDNRGMEVIFKNGSCVHIGDTTTKDLWKIIASNN